jgi:hypothetical protein
MHRVPGEHVCQLFRMAGRRAVTGGDLVWSDAKTFGDHPAHELGCRQLSSQGSCDMPATSISAGWCISGSTDPTHPHSAPLPDFQPGN